MELTLFLEPRPKERPRFTRSGHAFTPTRTRVFEAEAKRQARAQYKAAPLLGEVFLEITFYCTSPKKPSNPYPRGDLDNMVKAVSDALNGIVFKDDAQITNIMASKLYAEHKELPKIVIRIDHK